MDIIWVGEIDGEALVFDSAIQLAGGPHLLLWSSTHKEMGKYIADVTRKQIKPLGNSSAAAECIASYHVWQTSHGKAWIEEEMEYYKSRNKREAAQERKRIEAERARVEAERISNLTPAERHKE